MKLPREIRPATATIRSRIVLEIAAELVGRRDQPCKQAKVLLRAPNAETWQFGLFGSATGEGIDAAVRGQADPAVPNPAASVSLAFRGTGWLSAPSPVRAA